MFNFLLRHPCLVSIAPSKNFLLTATMRSKVADLGVARTLNLQADRLAVTMTQVRPKSLAMRKFIQEIAVL